MALCSLGDAVRKTVSVAKENGAKISALYVKLPPPAHYWSHVIWVNLPEPSAFEEFSEKEAQEARFRHRYLPGSGCRKWHQDLSDARAYLPVAIIDEATKSNCDLIFMASHGRRGIDALVLGSERTQGAHAPKIPVLVFR